MFPADLTACAKALIQKCQARTIRLVTAESCTGGLIAACLTEIPGSSSVFQAGFITYANEAKETILDIPPSLIRVQGAVSAEVVMMMARRALALSSAQIAVAVSGIAGPGGGSEDKPVGLVHIAIISDEGDVAHAAPLFKGDRTTVRLQAVAQALNMADRVATSYPGRTA